jgi:hypothetical protein
MRQEMADEGKSKRLAIGLTPEPPSALGRLFAVLSLVLGVPLLLGSGLCTFYFGATMAYGALYHGDKVQLGDIELILFVGGLPTAVGALLVWLGGMRLIRRRNG